MDLCNSVSEKIFVLAAILSGLIAAWLSFEGRFIRDLQEQMVDKKNPAGVGTDSVKFPYNLIARIRFGPPNRWLDLFDPTAKPKLVKGGKTSGFRILICVVIASTFSCIALYCR